MLEKQKEFNHEQQFHIAEQYLELAAKLFKKAGNAEDSYKSLALLSQATENHGDYRKK